MQAKGILPKAIIEGPPRRNCPILLRQTSFKALEEAVNFKNPEGGYETGHHTARFGEIEQRGVALTPKGRALYDKLLNQARRQLGVTPNADNASEYYQILERSFEAFPDDYQTLHDEGLAYFYYQAVNSDTDNEPTLDSVDVDYVNDALAKQAITDLLQQGMIRLEPIVYEDFLPVSAAGIFQSNLHDSNEQDNKNGEQNSKQRSDKGQANKEAFENALGAQVYDELELYQTLQKQSLKACLAQLNSTVLNSTVLDSTALNSSA